MSAAGWLYGSTERTREAARATADATYDQDMLEVVDWFDLALQRQFG